MSYELCLEKAGAKVIAFESFGDYQGSWYSLVDYMGKRGWVTGSYGSCSGCDAFESEFKDAYCIDESDHDLERRYAEFGLSYLEFMIPHEQQLFILENQLKNADDWYRDELTGIYNWVKEQNE